mgnify:CR=1 FL=1
MDSVSQLLTIVGLVIAIIAAIVFSIWFLGGAPGY